MTVQRPIGLALFCALSMIAVAPAQAQTPIVLHNFTLGGDGAFPIAGLTMDGAGNFYGTTADGGYGDVNCLYGCGVVFKPTRAQ